MSWIISFAIGLAVGVAYGLLAVRSPAPPFVALLGLLGMLAGENGVAAIKRSRVPAAQAQAVQPHQTKASP